MLGEELDGKGGRAARRVRAVQILRMQSDCRERQRPDGPLFVSQKQGGVQVHSFAAHAMQALCRRAFRCCGQRRGAIRSACTTMTGRAGDVRRDAA